MSYYLAEDPTYVLAVLAFAALICLIALQVSQQGKYLIWAGALLALALVVFGVERFWITDAEQIEAVVYDIAKGVETSDVARVESHLDTKVSIDFGGQSVFNMIPIRLVLPTLRLIRFDFLKVNHLTAQAGSQTRQGTAEFKVITSGSIDQSGISRNFATPGTSWSLGFRETAPNVWKVTRISVLDLPRQAIPSITGGR